MHGVLLPVSATASHGHERKFFEAALFLVLVHYGRLVNTPPVDQVARHA